MEYEGMIITLMSKFHNKALLKRVYRLVEYLYINIDRDYESNNAEGEENKWQSVKKM